MHQFDQAFCLSSKCLGFYLLCSFWHHIILTQAKPATLNPEGAPSRPDWAHGPMTGLSASGLLAASFEKQGGEEGVLY